MRRLLAASLMAFLFVPGVAAQSTKQSTKKTDTWKGFYVGGNVGGNSGRSHAQTTTPVTTSPTSYFITTDFAQVNAAGNQRPGSAGFTGGGQFGYNFQKGRLVAGLETDFGGMLMKDTKSTTTEYLTAPGSTFTITQSVKTDWVFTARPRIGFTAGHFLIYGTGGLALTNPNYQAVFTDNFLAGSHENAGVTGAKAGWTGGGGLEYQLPSHSHWSLKFEYLYADFGRVSTTGTNFNNPSTPGLTNDFNHTANVHTHIGRFGFNYRF